MALRRDLWLATDKTYKTAIEQGAAKRGFLESRVEKDTLPDFARETPTTIVAARIPLDFDVASWEEKFAAYQPLQRTTQTFRSQALR